MDYHPLEKNLEPQKSDFKSELSSMYEDPQATKCAASVAAAHNVVPTLQLDRSSPAKKMKMSMAQMMDKMTEQNIIINKLLEREKTLQPEKAAKPELLGPQPGTSGAEKTHNKRRRKKRNRVTESAEPTQIQEDLTEAGKEPTKDKPITLTVTFNEVELKEFFMRLSKS